MATSKVNHIEHYTRKLLWSNTGAISAGTVINLSSSDYDELEIHYTSEGTATAPIYDARCEKGRDVYLTHYQVTMNNTSDTFIMCRHLTRNSDTKFTADAGLIYRMSGAFLQGPLFALPLKIYGIKYIT